MKAPDEMLKASDPAALELLAKFDRVVMPNLGLSDAEVEQVIAYIGNEGQRTLPNPN